MDEGERTLGFIELPTTLKIQSQRVNVLHQLLVDRTLAEFVEGHIELTLLLKCQTQHAVRFGTRRFGLFLATLGHEEALGGEKQVADDKK